MQSVASNYRALIMRSSGPSGGTLLHVIRENAEASLCGIPRAALTGSGLFDELLCADCLEWFEKRRAVSRKMPTVRSKT